MLVLTISETETRLETGSDILVHCEYPDVIIIKYFYTF